MFSSLHVTTKRYRLRGLEGVKMCILLLDKKGSDEVKSRSFLSSRNKRYCWRGGGTREKRSTLRSLNVCCYCSSFNSSALTCSRKNVLHLHNLDSACICI